MTIHISLINSHELHGFFLCQKLSRIYTPAIKIYPKIYPQNLPLKFTPEFTPEFTPKSRRTQIVKLEFF